MKVVAFLQNQWFKDPDRVRRMFARHGPDRREVLVRTLLFYKSFTGRRLKEAFGEELCQSIVWEEASPEIGGKASACFAPDLAHIRAVITKHDPDVILYFGKVANEGVVKALSGMNRPQQLIGGPHPAARGVDVVDQLLEMAAMLRNRIEEEGKASSEWRVRR